MQYIELFEIPRGFEPNDKYSLGIEKREDKFFIWATGCGIGEAETIQVARAKCLEYAQDRLTADMENLQKRLKAIKDSLTKLPNDDTFHLAQFLVR